MLLSLHRRFTLAPLDRIDFWGGGADLGEQSRTLVEDDLEGSLHSCYQEVPALEARLLGGGDAYYYEHNASRELPVFRVIADVDENRR